MVGKGGYDEMVAKALDEALLHHELVKVKFQANRDQMEQIASQLAVATNSELVGKIGFISIFYRESEEHLITMPRALFK
jgi:RNA-binding protein